MRSDFYFVVRVGEQIVHQVSRLVRRPEVLGPARVFPGHPHRIHFVDLRIKIATRVHTTIGYVRVGKRIERTRTASGAPSLPPTGYPYDRVVVRVHRQLFSRLRYRRSNEVAHHGIYTPFPRPHTLDNFNDDNRPHNADAC